MDQLRKAAGGWRGVEAHILIWSVEDLGDFAPGTFDGCVLWMHPHEKSWVLAYLCRSPLGDPKTANNWVHYMVFHDPGPSSVPRREYDHPPTSDEAVQFLTDAEWKFADGHFHMIDGVVRVNAWRDVIGEPAPTPCKVYPVHAPKGAP
jgi:hypothetical protein